MPTVNEVVGTWLEKASQHPKSTVQALLTNIMFFLPFAVIFHWISPTLAATIGGMLAGYKQYLGGTQSDGDKQEALVDTPAGKKKEMVPAHLLPDDPKAEPVIDK